jgi:hypothetical protein
LATLRETEAALQQISPVYEFIDCKQLAVRWNVPETWIRERVRTRSEDPLPHVRFGKYVRFRWLSPELEQWAKRRIVRANNRTGRAHQ